MELFVVCHDTGPSVALWHENLPRKLVLGRYYARLQVGQLEVSVCCAPFDYPRSKHAQDDPLVCCNE